LHRGPGPRQPGTCQHEENYFDLGLMSDKGI
jgi:hypothetical protein